MINFDSVVSLIFTLNDSPTQSALLHIILCLILHYLTIYRAFNQKWIWYCVYHLICVYTTFLTTWLIFLYRFKKPINVSTTKENFYEFWFLYTKTNSIFRKCTICVLVLLHSCDLVDVKIAILFQGKSTKLMVKLLKNNSWNITKLSEICNSLRYID